MVPCIKKNVIEFSPQKWQQQLGEYCIGCHQKLTQDSAISLCSCPLFTHEKCFLKQYAPFITSNQRIICMRCDAEVKLNKNYKYQWSCENFKKPLVIISFVAAFLVLIAFIILTATGVYNDMASNVALYVMICVALVLLLVVVIFNLRIKRLYLEDISIDTDIKDSAANSQGNVNALESDKMEFQVY